MQSKIRLGLLFGGQSPEHEISIRSARSVIEHLDPKKYEVFPIGIDRKGSWHLVAKEELFLPIKREVSHFAITPQKTLTKTDHFSPCTLKSSLDVIFPMLHGPNGEDGTVQGLMKLANIPYVGPDHLSSAICMDKGVTKELLRAAGLPVPRYKIFRVGEAIDTGDFSYPLFVKPAQLGSSIGITKILTPEGLSDAVKEAFKHSRTILIEEGVVGQEIECSVLGNEEPIASLPGEVIPTHEFYSYEAKYLDPNGAHFVIPAKLSPEKIKEVQHLALAAFKTLHCEGMARVDFFLKKDGTLLINELNTIPGFTSISLYPKLWEVSGLPYGKLLDRLIELALERHFKNQGV